MRALRAQAPARSNRLRVYAFEGPIPGQQRSQMPAVRRENQNSSRRQQQLAEFAQTWMPVLQAEVAKRAQQRSKLAALQQRLALQHTQQCTPQPVAVAGAGVKLTAALLHTHEPRSSSSSFRAGDARGALSPAAGDAAGDAELVSLQQAVQSAGAVERELVGLLEACVKEVAGLVGEEVTAAVLPPQATTAAHVSNIVPTPWRASMDSAATPAAAAAPCDVSVCGDASSNIVPLPEALSSQQPSPSEPLTHATAEQLVLVYLNSSSTDDNNADTQQVPSVKYLRLPQQSEEYEAAVQQGLRVVPLPGALSSTTDNSSVGGVVDGCGSPAFPSASSPSAALSCISVEELAWMAQQQQVEVPVQEFFSSASASTAGDGGGGDDEGANAAEGEQSAAVTAAAAMAEDTTANIATHQQQQEEEQVPLTTTVKVELKVECQTKPGQRVVVVGSHPTLGSWDVSKAWKLKWSDGHIWKGVLELPAGMCIEFKAVLKSAETAIWERGSNRLVQLQQQQQGGGAADKLALQYAFKA